MAVSMKALIREGPKTLKKCKSGNNFVTQRRLVEWFGMNNSCKLGDGQEKSLSTRCSASAGSLTCSQLSLSSLTSSSHWGIPWEAAIAETYPALCFWAKKKASARSGMSPANNEVVLGHSARTSKDTWVMVIGVGVIGVIGEWLRHGTWRTVAMHQPFQFVGKITFVGFHILHWDWDVVWFPTHVQQRLALNPTMIWNCHSSSKSKVGCLGWRPLITQEGEGNYRKVQREQTKGKSAKRWFGRGLFKRRWKFKQMQCTLCGILGDVAWTFETNKK